ncbi:MAG TPA: glycosyltransferase family 87 protein [Gemmatimonadales bacterium]|nr:glycosyltransferase family 87 protein [Gemmatimonadales bacterium]
MDRPVAAARLTPRERRTLVVLGVLYAAVVIPIGIRKGGDFTQELGQSERLLRGLPLYAANPEGGIWWPPFTALGLAPFALVARWSLALAKACWAILNVGCLGWSLALARRWTAGWTPLVLAVAAVGKPLQSNFEHLNLTPMLLALVVAAAADLAGRRDGRAGAWIGLAGAIKGFPALLLVYLAYRRRWRGLAAGMAVGGALTLGAMLPYGPVSAVRAVFDWLRLSSAATSIGQLGTQSLPGFTFFLGWPPVTVVALELACVAAAVVALRRSDPERDAVYEVGLAAVIAVLVTPVAWLYYYTLAFPAWVAVLARPAPLPPRLRAVLLVAAALTSGLLTFGLYPQFLWFIREANYTWGGLLLVAALVAYRVTQPQRTLQPT